MSLKDQLIKLLEYMQTQMVGYPDFLTREQFRSFWQDRCMVRKR